MHGFGDVRLAALSRDGEGCKVGKTLEFLQRGFHPRDGPGFPHRSQCDSPFPVLSLMTTLVKLLSDFTAGIE
jgi:hypothetical protein